MSSADPLTPNSETPPATAAAPEPAASWAVATPQRVDRRTLLVATGTAVAGLVGYSQLRQPQAPVFIAANQTYEGPLEQTIRDGLLATGFQPTDIKGKKVLLKPNLVEPTRSAPHMTTHPRVVRAAAEVFRRWDAHVSVGEAPGHVRDTEMAVYESGLAEILDADKIPFADLNYEETGWVLNLGKNSKLAGFHFPKSVLEADLVVSMPKMKTHHWVGLTISLKNMYGILPGVKYGWPKNVLHHAGIPETVADINLSLKKMIAIVDGIVCMEGDGPIMGSPKSMGLIVVGTQPAAVDATCARLMGLEPRQVNYLQLAEGRLGPLSDRRILQSGENWKKLADPFRIVDAPHLKRLQSSGAAILTSQGKLSPQHSFL